MKNKISVIMSAYKPSRDGLYRTVNSVLNQTFTDFEFIIINDDDTKETQDLINELVSLDNRIKIIANEKNIGLVKSLNKGLHISIGEFIARIDVDDWWAANKLELQYKYMVSNKLDLLGTLANFVDDNLQELDFINCSDVEQQIRNGRNPFVHSSVMFRKIEDMFYNEKALHVEDFELWCRFYIIGKIGCLDKKITNYIITNNGITGKKRYIMFRNSIIIYKNFVKQLISKDKKRKELINKPIIKMNKYSILVNTLILNKAMKNKFEKNKFKQYLYFSLAIIFEPTILFYLSLRKYYNYILKMDMKK